jgi:hypothetical protein
MGVRDISGSRPKIIGMKAAMRSVQFAFARIEMTVMV